MSRHTLPHLFTRIICTLGPSTNSRESIARLAEAGMSIARLNFSHGSAAEHLQAIENIKQVRSARGEYIAIGMDTKGPELRVLLREDIHVEAGAVLKLLSERDYFRDAPQEDKHPESTVCGESCSPSFGGREANCPGCAEMLVGTNIKDFSAFETGDILLLDDRKLKLSVTNANKDLLCAVAENSHVLRTGKKISTDKGMVNRSWLGDEDVKDIMFALSNEVDVIFLSFAETSGDVEMVRSLCGDSSVQLIAKIETKRGLEMLDEISSVSDGIMIARGDLGTDVGLASLFSAQMRMLELTSRQVVIMATEMMQTMVDFDMPTCAEVSDVGNAVVHGCHAVMLSSETAIGKHAVSCVEMVRRVCLDAESYLRSVNMLHLPSVPEYLESRGLSAMVEHKAADGGVCIFAKGVPCIRPLTFLKGVRVFVGENRRG